ncbi:hypothetical protein KC218_21155, partial [Mycobacterium tuberculosis]|nr:hypothetical protein [Mycobacterium tuberculosis]
IFLVEQNVRQALKIAQHGYVLETGEIVLADSGKNLLGNPRVLEAYLGGCVFRTRLGMQSCRGVRTLYPLGLRFFFTQKRTRFCGRAKQVRQRGDTQSGQRCLMHCCQIAAT